MMKSDSRQRQYRRKLSAVSMSPEIRQHRLSTPIDRSQHRPLRRRDRMSVAQDRPRTTAAAGLSDFLGTGDDPVTRGLRQAARRIAGIGIFSGVINILMLSGSIYMMQVYDRVIPSRNLAMLAGLSLMILLAYVMQGYFDALRARMLCRVATVFDAGLQEPIHHALATLPLRGTKPMLMQQPLRDHDQLCGFMLRMGPTVFLVLLWFFFF